MKKYAALLFALILMFSLCACSRNENTSNPEFNDESSESISNDSASNDSTPNDSTPDFESIMSQICDISRIWISTNYDNAEISLFSFDKSGVVAKGTYRLDDYYNVQQAASFISYCGSSDSPFADPELQLHFMDSANCDVVEYSGSGDTGTFTDENGNICYQFTCIYQPAANGAQAQLLGVGDYTGEDYLLESYGFNEGVSLDYLYGNWSVAKYKHSVYNEREDIFENNYLIHFNEDLSLNVSGDYTGNGVWSLQGNCFRVEAINTYSSTGNHANKVTNNDDALILVLDSNTFVCYYNYSLPVFGGITSGTEYNYITQIFERA